MTNSEIEYKILELERKIETKKEKKKSTKDEQKALEEYIDAAQKEKRAMENAYQQAMDTIELRLRRVDSRSKFPSVYRARAKTILMGSKATASIEDMNSAIKEADKRYQELGDQLKTINREIKELEDDIALLKRQMM